MGNGRKRVTDMAGIILGLVLAIGVLTVFRACPVKEDGTWMACHQVQILLMWLGIGIAVVSAGAFFVQGAGSVILDVIRILLALAGILIPGNVMNMCMMDTMRCHSVMVPFARIVCVVILIFMVKEIAAYFYRKNGKSKV